MQKTTSFLFKRVPTWIEIIFVCIAIVGVTLVYTERQFIKMTTEIESSKAKTDEQFAGLNQTLKLFEKSIIALEGRNSTLANALENEKSKNGKLLDQFNDIEDTVGGLEKLSKTDPQLLQKYSKVYFLNDNYIPVQLADIDKTFAFNKKVNYQIHASVAPHLNRLLSRAKDAGLDLQIISAYRSFGEQAALKSSYKVTYGTTKANQFSADQGYSEHQLGTTIDFTTGTVGSTFEKFEKTPEYNWLLANAHKYGFTLSYPANNKYYQFEPWHWRFVGIELATRLHNEEKYFYDYDQRKINEYLGNMFD
jgi:LAS superfamily LD-carboxypeptidase LdcB